MASSLEIDHKKMYDIKSAATASGYSRDHVTTLARANKIVAAQVGRQWYIDLDSLQRYAEITQLEQKIKQKHLGEERKATREITDSLEQLRVNKLKRRNHKLAKTKSSILSLAAFVALVASSLTILAPEIFAPVSEQVASAPKSVPVTLTAFDGQKTVPVVRDTMTTFSDGGVSVVTVADPEEAIVLLPEGLSSSTAVFSDEVEIVSNENGEQRIFLEGVEDSEGVRFVTVEVSEITIP